MSDKGMLANAIDDYDSRHETANADDSQELVDKGNEILNDDKCCYDESKNLHCSEECPDEKEQSEPNLFNEDGEMNFVKAGNNEILNFIQDNIRNRNKLEKELDQTQGVYDDTLAKNKADFINHESVVKYSTLKERMIALDQLAESAIDYTLLNEMSDIKEKVYDIKNELDLAREIYRLKNI